MQYIYVEECTSTMDVAKQKWDNKQSNGVVIHTHHQTNGRGRKERRWVSQKNDIIFTLLVGVKTEEELRKIGIVSLLSMTTVLKSLCEGKKLFGVLIEADWVTDQFNVNIGVGLNVETSELSTSISLNDLKIEEVEEKKVIEMYYNTFFEYIQYEQNVLLKKFSDIDYLKGKEVKIHIGNGDCVGFIKGYTVDWKVIVENVDGTYIVDREEIVI
ncbi:Biotin--acetyl-CoA-carboxylase ligase [Entamoeba marina]